MADKLTISLTILLTGFIVVFAVLLLLIGIIKLYGTIVYKCQNNIEKKKAEELKRLSEDKTEKSVNVVPQNAVPLSTAGSDISGEVIAVIAAAVESLYGPAKAKIKSIRKSSGRRNAWRNAGVSDNTRPF